MGARDVGVIDRGGAVDGTGADRGLVATVDDAIRAAVVGPQATA